MGLISRMTKLLALALSGIAIVLIVCLILARPLIQFATNYLLAPSGLSVRLVDPIDLSLSQLSIPRLIVTNQENQSTTTIDELELSYSLSSLRQRTLDTLTIAQISVEPKFWELGEPTHPDESHTNGASLPSAQLLITPLLRLVEIERLKLSTQTEFASAKIQFSSRSTSVDIVHSSARVSAVVNWHNQDYTSSLFIDSDEANPENFSPDSYSGNLIISYRDIDALNVELTLHEHMEFLQAHTQIDSEQFQLLLATLGLWPEDTLSITGGLELDLTIDGFNTNPKIQAFTRYTPETSIHWQDQAGHSSIYLREAAEPQPTEITFDLDSGLTLAPLRQNIVASYAGEHGSMNADIALLDLSAHCSLDWQCSASANVRAASELIALQDIRIENTELITQFKLTANLNSLKLDISQAQLQSASLQGSQIHIKNGAASLSQALSLTLEQFNKATLEQAGIIIELPQVIAGESTAKGVLSLSNLQGSTLLDSPEQSHLQTTVFLSEMQFVNTGLKLPDIRSDMSITAMQLLSTGQLIIEDEAFAEFNAQHDIANNRGTAAAIQSPLEFSSPSSRRETLEQLLPLESHFIEGNMHSKIELEWQQEDSRWQYRGNSELSISNLSGSIDEIAFIDLSTSVQLKIEPGPSVATSTPATLSLARLDPGIPIENIAAIYSIDQANNILIRDISGSIFGGKVRSQRIEYNWLEPNSEFIVDIESIDLAKIMELGSYEAVKATGLISGGIPLRFTGDTIQVSSGELAALNPGGSIQYSAPETPSNNASLELVNEALSNYQYDKLQAGIAYKDNGDLILGVTLEGQNPDMNNGQRINLNLNITDNIPALLRSLQAGRNINEAVERQLNKSQ